MADPAANDEEIDPESDADLRASSLVGTRIGNYEVLRVLGRGGMGCVYEARNPDIDKRVAIKCIDHALALRKDAVARFQREALAVCAVESPHIVQIFDAGTTAAGLPYIVMELLHGEDLGTRLATVGRLEVGEALAVMAQILRGIGRAHEKGIVHRDLKPDNTFLVEREDEPALVKVLDFGVSKMAQRAETPLKTLTREGTVVGTPYYMAPEQAQSLPDVDARADIFACGAILFECLSGRPPHIGASYEQVIVNICMHDADDIRLHNAAVPEPVADLVRRALARDREERFQSAREMLDAVIEVLPPGDVEVHARAIGSSGTSRPGQPGAGAAARTPANSGELAATVRFDTPRPAALGAEMEASTKRTHRSRLGWLIAAGAAAFIAALGIALGSRVGQEATPGTTVTHEHERDASQRGTGRDGDAAVAAAAEALEPRATGSSAAEAPSAGRAADPAAASSTARAELASNPEASVHDAAQDARPGRPGTPAGKPPVKPPVGANSPDAAKHAPALPTATPAAPPPRTGITMMDN